MQACPIRIPTVSNDTDWDFCFHLSQQTEIPACQQTEELCTTCGSGESEEDTTAQTEEIVIDCMSLPKEKLAQAQKKIVQLIKEKMASGWCLLSSKKAKTVRQEAENKDSQARAWQVHGQLQVKEQERAVAAEVREARMLMSELIVLKAGKREDNHVSCLFTIGTFLLNIQANKELIRCVILSRIIFGEDHWKCAQALASLAYGYLTLRGLPAQAKKHAESAKTTLLTWKGNTTSDKEKKEILDALVMLYYTVGVAWLLQNQEAYFNLQKAERNMKELKELCKGSVCGLQVSEKDLTIALGRASLAIHRLNLALAYFEKAVGNVIAAKGGGTPDLISLYEEVAQTEQLRRNHDKAIQYLKQAHSICVSSFTEVSPQTAEASALLARAYAMSGEPQHKDAIETYYIKSISAYQVTLGSEDSETLATIEEFCKWLVQNGEKQEAYRLLKSLLKSQVISYGDCSEKVAETFYNMARICFAEGELGKAIQLLRKVEGKFGALYSILEAGATAQ